MHFTLLFSVSFWGQFDDTDW